MDYSDPNIDPNLESVVQSEREVFQSIIDENLTDTDLGKYLQTVMDMWWFEDLSRRPLARLPNLVCRAYGGKIAPALPITVAWRLLCLAAKLFDDVEDGDVNSMIREQLNTATSLVFLAQLVLRRLQADGLSTDLINHLIIKLNQVGLKACAGQYADINGQKNPVCISPDDWLKIALAKSGAPYAWAAWAGALVAGASEPDLNLMWQYGQNVGVLLQITDDLHSLWDEKENFSRPYSNLPVNYASWVLQGENYTCLTSLLDKAAIGNVEVVGRIKQIVEEAGAKTFISTVARMQLDQAIHALESTSLPLNSRQPLRELPEAMLPWSVPLDGQKNSHF